MSRKCTLVIIVTRKTSGYKLASGGSLIFCSQSGINARLASQIKYSKPYNYPPLTTVTLNPKFISSWHKT